MPNTSHVDYYQLGLAAATLANPDVTVFEGDIVDMLLSAGASMADRNDQENARDHKSLFVEGAEGDDLTTLADDRYTIDRAEATAATVTLSFSRPSAGGGEPGGTIAAGSECATPVDAVGDDIRFATDFDVIFALAELGPKLITATAITAGPDTNVQTIGGVSRIISTVFDTSLAVASTTVAAGGNVEEDDPDLRGRIRDKPNTAARATMDALIFGALTVPSVRVASAIADNETGTVTVSVSDADGNSNAEMVRDVIVALGAWQAFGLPPTVVGGVRVLADLTLSLKLKVDTVLSGLVTPVTDTVTGEINKLKQGGVLYDTLSISSAKNVAPDLIDDVTITAITIDGVVQPLGDYVPASNELIRVGSITVVEEA